MVQALDSRHDHVVVDVADNLFDTLASVADQHGQARRRTASARCVLASHVARDHGVLVSASAELLKDGHQLVGVALRLEERDRCRTIIHLRLRELPNLPWVHVCDVFALRQARHVHTNLWAGADAHVVGECATRGINHRLRIAAKVSNALTVHGAGQVLVASQIVWLAAQWVVVQHSADYHVADQPHFAWVAQIWIGNLFLGQAPLLEQAALD